MSDWYQQRYKYKCYRWWWWYDDDYNINIKKFWSSNCGVYTSILDCTN